MLEVFLILNVSENLTQVLYMDMEAIFTCLFKVTLVALKLFYLKLFFQNFLKSVRSHCESISMARLQGHLMSFRDPLEAIENGHLLKGVTISTDFNGEGQKESPELKLENFLQ